MDVEWCDVHRLHAITSYSWYKLGAGIHGFHVWLCGIQLAVMRETHSLTQQY